MTSRQRRILCGAYSLLLLLLSIMPADWFGESPGLFPHQDKLVHLLMYAGLAFLLAWTLQRRVLRHQLARHCLIVAAAAGYGALMEVLQGLMIWTQRSFSWGDILANLAGAIIGAIAATLIQSGRSTSSG